MKVIKKLLELQITKILFYLTFLLSKMSFSFSWKNIALKRYIRIIINQLIKELINEHKKLNFIKTFSNIKKN